MTTFAGLLLHSAGFRFDDAAPWWLCPNTPRCPHGAILHDVEDLDDETPMCCVEGCDCGHRDGSRCSDNTPAREAAS